MYFRDLFLIYGKFAVVDNVSSLKLLSFLARIACNALPFIQ